MSTTALPVHIALVDETGMIDEMELARAAGALNEQVVHHFGPIWHVRATVGAYPKAPPSTWSVRIQRDIPGSGALGYHTDELNQPKAYVQLARDWTITVSHEILEMLADPWGNRPHGGRLPSGVEERFKEFGLKSALSHVSYLLEVADPPERYTYDIGGIEVSDFILPAWYRSTEKVATAYSFAGGCKRPREVAAGGYVSFHVDGDWWQVFNDGRRLTTGHLGRFDRQTFGSLRAFSDHHARVNRPA